MESMKLRLLKELHKIPGIEDRPSPVAEGTALFYFGKEFAHFHSATELDLRLTRKVIKALGLQHPSDSLHHPKRSPNFPWIEVRFFNAEEVNRVVELVKIAITQR